MSDQRYRCRTCRKWFQREATRESCCVLHGAGDCCHFMEIEVTKKGWVKPVSSTVTTIGALTVTVDRA